MTMSLDDFPAEVRDTVRDFAQVFVRTVDSRDEITAERVEQAMREELANPRGMDGFYATARNAALREVLRERLAETYDEFRVEATS